MLFLDFNNCWASGQATYTPSTDQSTDKPDGFDDLTTDTVDGLQDKAPDRRVLVSMQTPHYRSRPRTQESSAKKDGEQEEATQSTSIGNFLSSSAFTDGPPSLVPIDLSNSTSGYFEMCFTWWSMDKRFFYSCTANDTNDILEGFGQGLMKCLLDIRKLNSLDESSTVSVLKLDATSRCLASDAMIVQVCILYLRNNTWEGKMIQLKVVAHPRHFLFFDSDTMLAYGLQLKHVRTAILFTVRSESECGILALGGNSGIPEVLPTDFFLPTRYPSCLVQRRDGKLYGESCLENAYMSYSKFAINTNCSMSEETIGMRSLLSKKVCASIRVRAICMTESFRVVNEQEDHEVSVMRFCSATYYSIEGYDYSPSQWKEQVIQECLRYYPSKLEKDRRGPSNIKTIEVPDEAVHLMEVACFVLNGRRLYSIEIASGLNILQMLQMCLSLSGTILNAFVLVHVIVKPLQFSGNVYLVGLLITNLCISATKIVEISLDWLELFHQAICYVFPIVDFTFTNISLLVLLGLSVERTVAVCWPLLTRKWCTASRSRKVSIYFKNHFIYPELALAIASFHGLSSFRIHRDGL